MTDTNEIKSVEETSSPKKSKNMLVRILTAIVSIAIFVPVCIFSSTIVFNIFISVLCLVGTFEVAKCLGFHKNLALTIPVYLISAGLPILRHFQGGNRSFYAFAMIGLFAILLYFLSYVMLRKNKDDISKLLTFFALTTYVVGCFCSILAIRRGPNGASTYLLAFLGAWICDTFAYFTGVLIGKHKLIPEISPKKTIEGSIGGIVFTIIGFIVYGLIMNSFFEANISYIYLAILGLILSIVSQMGDLIASAVKRQYGIKDYGFIFPGHGGVIDRFDSVMLCAPVLLVFNTIIFYFNL